MKRICLLLVVLLCCGLLALPVSARSSAETMQIEVNMEPNGACIVEMTVDVTFDSGVDDPKFPIPAAATEISLNGGAATTTTRGQITWISLKRVGDGTFHLRYRLPAVVSTDFILLPFLSMTVQFPIIKAVSKAALSPITGMEPQTFPTVKLPGIALKMAAGCTCTLIPVR